MKKIESRNAKILLIVYFILVVLYILNTSAAQAEENQIERAIEDASEIYGVDPNLVRAMVQVESRRNPKAVGAAGEIGLLQLHPKYFPEAKHNITENIWMGVAYLSEVQAKCRQDYGYAAFICYNHSPYRRVKDPTRFDYYLKVMQAMGGDQ